MLLNDRIAAFAELGKHFRNESDAYFNMVDNPWFTNEDVGRAIRSFGELLSRSQLEGWLAAYPQLKVERNPKNILVLMAGNIPLVGFHDFLCVLLSGHHFVGKLSSDDRQLLPKIADKLIEIEPRFRALISFVEKAQPPFDFVIATGSNNSGRYFEHYFGKYPHLIRKHRNSCAVLSGREAAADLEGLASDIFTYFGKGCRSVSKIFIPEDYDLTTLQPFFEKYAFFKEHTSYMNNYDYQKAIALMNIVEIIDGGFYLLLENPSFASPLAVIYYERYRQLDDVRNKLEQCCDELQCVVAAPDFMPNSIAFGSAQAPGLGDFADGVDVLTVINP